jgi:tetratricopeptide (TPR) repeat protein
MKYLKGNKWLLALLIMTFLSGFAGIPSFRETDPEVLQLQEELQKDSNNPQIRAELAAVYFEKYKKGKQLHYLEAAIGEARKAIRLNPDCGLAHFILSLALIEKGTESGNETLLDEAVREYREALRAGPALAVADRYPPVQFLAATKYLALSERDSTFIDDAVRELREAIRVKQGYAPSHVILGGIYYHLKGKKGPAIREMREALQLDPDYLEAHRWLGGIYVQELKRKGGRGDDETIALAIEQYRQVLRIDPEDDEAHRNLAWLYRYRGRFEVSFAEATRALTLKKCAENHKALGEAHLWKGNYEGALEEFEKAVRENPDYEEAYYSKAFTYYLQRRFNNALEVVKRCIEFEDPPRIHTILLHYLALNAVGNDAEARKLLEECARTVKGEAWEAHLLSYLRGHLSKSELIANAEDSWERCEAYFYIGCQYFHKAKREKAKHFFQKAMHMGSFSTYEYVGARARLEELRGH